jgi:ComF family protein
MTAGLLTKIYQIVIEAVFPTRCLVCGDFFQAPQYNCGSISGESALKKSMLHVCDRTLTARSLSTFLCPRCIQGLIVVEPPLCVCCGLPFKSRQGEDHRCGDCIASPKKFRFARVSLVYEKNSTEVVHCFKYKSKIQLAGSLSALLLTTFRLFWEKDSVDIIVPVPLHPKRLRQRGFNQAYLLIRNWQMLAASAPSDLCNLQIERDVLVRTRPTAPQTSLGRARRAANIKNAFDIRSREKINNKRVLLVDDVYTTGATVNECARLLLKYGAEHVDVLTLARAV